MDIVWKGVVGGLVTALIVWASKRGNLLPGIRRWRRPSR